VAAALVKHGYRGTAPTVEHHVEAKQVVRKTNVVVVLDLSGSMSDEAFGRLTPAKAAIMELFDDVLLAGDSLTIITFNTEVTTVMPRCFKWEPKEGQVKQSNQFVRADLEAVVSRLQAGGGTALYHALLQAMEQTKAAATGDLMRAKERKCEAAHTFQLFVITDGLDEDSAHISPSSTARAVNELLKKPGGWAGEVKFSSCFVGIGADAQAALAPCTKGLNQQNHFTVDNITDGFRRVTDQILVERVERTQTFRNQSVSVGGGAAAAR
jgi:Mg-chelatase subunit ChlD